MATLVTVLERLEQVNTVTGITFNLLLLYAIRKFSGTNLGTYKYLLTCFTLADMFLVIMHVMMHPRAILIGCTHAVVTDTIFEDRSVTASFVAFQSVPFTLLGIHFLFRYWSVRRPHLIELFSNKKFIMLLISITVGSLLSWYLMTYYGTTGSEDNIARRTIVDAYEQKYGKRIEKAWIVLDHWRDGKFDVVLFMTVLVTNLMMISSLISACLLAILTFYHIKRADKMSAQINILQRKLLIALCAQAFVPSVFVYIPYVLTINIPFFQIPVYFFHDITIPLFTCFPVWDAAIMILLISDYRKGLMGMIRKNRVHEESSFRVTGTSSNVENSYAMHLSNGIVVALALIAIVAAECNRPAALSAPFAVALYNKTDLGNGKIQFACPKSHMTYGNFGAGGSLVFEVRGNIHTCDSATGKYFANIENGEVSALATMSCVSNPLIVNNASIGLCTFNSKTLSYVVLNGSVVHCSSEGVKIVDGEMKGQIVPSLSCVKGTLITKLANGTEVNVVRANLECIIAGLSLNALLLYAIIQFSGTRLGTYKQLLTIFTVSNAFLVILHELVHPRAILVGCTHGGTSDTVLDDRRITALNAAFESVPFTLLGIHFLYRYWSVRKPHLIKLFSRPKFVSLLISITAGQLMSWYLMSMYGTTGQEDDDAKRTLMAEYERKYGKRIENAWIILDHWRDNKINPTLLFMVISLNIMMISALILAAILAVLTFHYLNITSKISTKSTQLQRKLLIALCAQASVPSLFVYTPYLLVMNIPFFRIPVTVVHDMSVPISTCFPAWDAAIIIMLISDYRKGIMRMIRKETELKISTHQLQPVASAAITI